MHAGSLAIRSNYVIDNWDRKPYFEHYLHQTRCTYSMTATIDITHLHAELKSMGVKLYPALIYMLATVVNRHREFRTCFDSEGSLGFWDRMTPSFTIFHEQCKTFSSIWTPFSEDFKVFYERCLGDLKEYGDVKQLFPKPDEPLNT